MQKETQKHLDAFEKYFQYKMAGHSTEDAIRRLISHGFGARNSIFRWKRSFDWDNRLAERQEIVNKKVQNLNNDSIVESKTWLISTVKKEIEEYVNDKNMGLIEGITISTITDLDRAVRLLLFLYGEPSERIEERNEGLKEFANILRESIKETGNRES